MHLEPVPLTRRLMQLKPMKFNSSIFKDTSTRYPRQVFPLQTRKVPQKCRGGLLHVCTSAGPSPLPALKLTLYDDEYIGSPVKPSVRKIGTRAPGMKCKFTRV